MATEVDSNPPPRRQTYCYILKRADGMYADGKRGWTKSQRLAFRFRGFDALSWAGHHADTFPKANIKIIRLRGSGKRRG